MERLRRDSTGTAEKIRRDVTLDKTILLATAGGRTRMQTKQTKPAMPDDNTELDLGALMRHIAHEIANPLNAILMNAEMAKSLVERGDTQRATEALTRLLGDCDRCVKLMRGMQHFGAGMNQQAPAEVPVRELIEGATSNIVFEYAGAMPVFRVESLDASLDVDRAAVERALVALLRNSAEAGATEVTLRGRKEKNAIVIDICDNGPGMDDKAIERVITGFHTSKRAQGCIGLGIAMARELVRKQNGTLEIRANSPRGLMVSIRFPAPRC